jgi:hypothetical protein
VSGVLKGCDHADGTPAACLRAGRTRRRRASRGSPAAPLCATLRVPGRALRTMACPARPREDPIPRDPGAASCARRLPFEVLIPCSFERVRYEIPEWSAVVASNGRAVSNRFWEGPPRQKWRLSGPNIV